MLKLSTLKSGWTSFFILTFEAWSPFIDSLKFTNLHFLAICRVFLRIIKLQYQHSIWGFLLSISSEHSFWAFLLSIPSEHSFWAFLLSMSIQNAVSALILLISIHFVTENGVLHWIVLLIANVTSTKIFIINQSDGQLKRGFNIKN